MAEMNDLEIILDALASPARRAILQFLKADDPPRLIGDAGRTASEIQAYLKLAQATTSAHLHILQEAGLLHVRRLGQFNIYSRHEEAIHAFIQMLAGSL